MLRIIICMAFIGLLAGCSPDYNWRDVTLGNGAVKATFPDEPETHTRMLTFAGHQIEFVLTVAQVHGALFAVGYAQLPEALRDDPSVRHDMGREVVRSLYRNAGAAVPSELPDWGASFEIKGHTPKTAAVTLNARVWVPSHALIDAVVTADAGSFPQQQADDFLRSIVVAE